MGFKNQVHVPYSHTVVGYRASGGDGRLISVLYLRGKTGSHQTSRFPILYPWPKLCSEVVEQYHL